MSRDREATRSPRARAGVDAAAADKEKTPLAKKLDEFGHQLTNIIGAVCAATFCAAAPRFGSPIFGGNKLRGAMHYAKGAVALGVAAIPEGLPAVITLCLSLGTRRMARRRVVVRRLPSVETLGCTSVICSDKTGTLTTNAMTAVALLLPDGGGGAREIKVEGKSYDPTDGGLFGEAPGLVDRDAAALKSAAVCAFCNDAQLAKDPETGGFVRVGEPTEAALRVLAEKLGAPKALEADCADLDDAYAPTAREGKPFFSRETPSQPRDGARNSSAAPALLFASPQRLCEGIEEDQTVQNLISRKPVSPRSAWQRAAVCWRSAAARTATLEFDRGRKSMSVVCSDKTLYVKGAPDSIIARCATIRDPSTGKAVPLDDDTRKRVTLKVNELARRPLRCLAFATRGSLPSVVEGYAPGDSLPKALDGAEAHEALESDLCLEGVAGIRDPPRPEAKVAIAKCRAAGVRVFMITGDSRETAVAIGEELGILEAGRGGDRAWEGAAFFADESEAGEATRAALLAPEAGDGVFCRTAPADKQRIIKLLADAHGDVTAMTGDGVNDAPALQQASIGIAMGITGTEVAKQAADMVLMDDDFATIVAAVEEGRAIYKNMQAFVCFLLSFTAESKSLHLDETKPVWADSCTGAPPPSRREGESDLDETKPVWAVSCRVRLGGAALKFLRQASPNVISRMSRRCNFGEVATVFGATLLGVPDVLTPLQLLWVNLVTDGPPATALGFNPPDPDAMSRPPRDPTAPILTPWLLARYAITGSYVGFATIRVFLDEFSKSGVSPKRLRNWASCDVGSPDWADFAPFAAGVATAEVDPCALAFGAHGAVKATAQTLSLSTLVAMEMLKALSAVSLDHSLLRVAPWANPWLLGGVALPVALHVGLLYQPQLRSLFGLVALDAEQWATVAKFSLPILLVEEATKLLGRYLDDKERRARVEAEALRKSGRAA